MRPQSISTALTTQQVLFDVLDAGQDEPKITTSQALFQIALAFSAIVGCGIVHWLAS